MFRFLFDEFGWAGVRVLRAVVLLVLLCGVAGCGSSSSSSGGEQRNVIFEKRVSPAVTLPANPGDYTTKLASYEASSEYNWTLVDRDGTEYPDPQLARIKAANAYARGATGAGVTITVVDTGIRTTHKEFGGSGKVTVRNLFDDYNPELSDLFHGTAVAALAAGNINNDGEMHGVAFDAKIDFLSIFLNDPSPDPDPTDVPDPDDGQDEGTAAFFRAIFNAANGDILNFSFNAPGKISGYSPAAIRRGWAQTAAAIAQAGTLDADKKIIAWAAGNAGEDSPEVFAGLGVDFPELQSIIVAVVGLEADGRIAGRSNRCGVAKNYCIAAPGWSVYTADFRGDNAYFFQDGTSFAAPIVAGSLAVIKQFFRDQLGNTELVDRLFATADRSGIYANSDIYGQGLVDLDNATKPQGMIITGLPGDKDAVPLSQTGFTLTGNAFGASFAELGRIEIAGFDELGAPFFFPATSLIAHTARDTSPPPTKLSATLPNGKLALRADAHGATQSGYLQHNNYLLAYGENPAQFFGNARTRDNVNDAFNFADNDHRFNHINIGFGNNNAFVSPYLSLAQNGTSAGWRNDNGRFGFAFMQGNAHFDQWQDNGGERGLGLLMDWTTHTKHGAIALQAGAVRETDSLLGARANQSDLSAQTLFAGINIAHRFGNWQTLASAYFGNTEPTARNAYWQLDDTIKSGAFAFAASRQSWQSQHDQLTIRLTQPLRTERAQATLNMPAGRTKYGEVIHQQHNIDLSPNGRTLQLEAAYQTPVAIKSHSKNKSTVQTAIGVERHPMHDAARDSRWYVRLGVETRF